jgi:glycosyltransferase involved in cell wall biosynthesis
MDILFLGGVFAKDQEETIYNKSKGNVQFAANALQWNIIEGLDTCNGSPITLLNSIFVGSFPKLYNNIYIKSRSWSHHSGANDKDVGFLNLFGVKHIWRGIALTKQIIKWARNESIDKKVIVVYSMNTPFIYAAIKAKQINPNIHICLLCPDLPEFMNLGVNKGYFFNTLKSIDRYAMSRLIKSIDSFVFLTKYMKDRISVGIRPWIVMEGVVNLKELNIKQNNYIKKGKEKAVLYTGTLNKAYGIIRLLEAFTLIDDPSIHLWICGAGEAQLEIEKFAVKDIRIKYLGQVSRDYAMQLQREADLLINPRNDEGEFTKYSFPSKTMEYMLSGTPVLIYRLAGIPDEYYKHLFTIDGDGPEHIALSICQVLNRSTKELDLVGVTAQNFVIDKKNNVAQAKRIIDLISGE